MRRTSIARRLGKAAPLAKAFRPRNAGPRVPFQDAMVNAAFTNPALRRYASDMASMIAISLVAAQIGAAAPAASIPSWNSRVSATALASVRIMSAARISLSDETQPEGYKVVDARITVEDGSRRPAKLIEFQ